MLHVAGLRADGEDCGRGIFRVNTDTPGREGVCRESRQPLDPLEVVTGKRRLPRYL